MSENNSNKRKFAAFGDVVDEILRRHSIDQSRLAQVLLSAAIMSAR